MRLRPFLFETGRTITAEGLAGSATQLVPADSVVVVARGATCGRFVVLGQSMAMNKTCYALSAKNSEARWYLRFLFERLIQRLVAQAHGSVFDTITTSTFQAARSLTPDARALKEFEERVGPLVERIRSSIRESRNLADLRDALLPKLLSGELSVAKLERAVEAAT